MIINYQTKSSAASAPSQWYVMAPIYRQEIKIKEYLDRRGVRNYLPTHSSIRKQSSRKQITQSPAVSGLLFVYTTEEDLKLICAAQPYLYYKYDRAAGSTRKMVVPHKEMENFIRVSNLEREEVVYFDPKDVELNLTSGVPIRLHSSNPAINGIEGYYVKVRGRREKQLVISLNGYHAVAMMVNVDIIERL